MLIDFAKAGSLERFEADLCIVGAGAAGITLARRLATGRRRILLLESGGLDHDPLSAALGVGENIGAPYYDLADSRLRFFGGTINIWGGRCATLDAIDFEQRGWVPHSGWPIGPPELVEGYQRAQRDLQIGPIADVAATWSGTSPARLVLDPDRFTLGYWRFDTQRERFSGRRIGDVLSAPNIQAVIHATVVHVQANPEGNGLKHLLIRNLAGRQGLVKAGVYVLACGGIENARLLLASRDIEGQGIGNRSDQVGRYFMEHPHGRLGRINTTQPGRIWSAFRIRFPRHGAPVAPVLLAAPGWQRRRRILNTALTFKWHRNPAAGLSTGRRTYNRLKAQLPPSRRNRLLWRAYRHLRMVHDKHTRPMATRLLAHLQDFQLSAMIRADQAPNPASRVVLSEQRDRLGSPKANLDWRLGELDKHSLRELAAALNDALVRLQLGTFTTEPWVEDRSLNWPVDPTVGNHPIGGYHHMGTTRMSLSPAEGVVDRNCAVHGYRDLYIAGSSVFPTAGWANPTLTIMALAHRLADHLGARS